MILIGPGPVAVATTMRCPICNAENAFEATEYVMPRLGGTVRAPALECLECHAVVLNEVAAHSTQELEAVREAQRLRHSMSGPTEHGRASRRSGQVGAHRSVHHVY
jgi:hypothetical protein